jgi:hypothetical protein
MLEYFKNNIIIQQPVKPAVHVTHAFQCSVPLANAVAMHKVQNLESQCRL